MTRKIKRSIFFLFALFLVCLLSAIYCGVKGVVADDTIDYTDDYVYLLDFYQIENYSEECLVTNPNGKSIEVDSNGKFLVLTPGKYIISYPNGKTIILHSEIETEMVEISSDFDTEYLYSPNDQILISSARLTSQYSSYISKNFDLYLEGIKILENISFEGDGYPYTINSAGKYTIAYKYKSVFGAQKEKTIEFNVKNVPVFVFDKYSVEVDLNWKIRVQDAKLLLNGLEFLPTIEVVDKNGISTMVYDSFVFNKEGNYTIIFHFIVDGKMYSYERVVTVKIGYGAYFVNSNLNVTSNVSTQESSVVDSGVLLTPLERGGSTYFSNLIDLSKLGNKDIIKFQSYDSNGFLEDVRISLIDAYDPNITVDIYWYQNIWNDSLSYIVVEYGTVSGARSNEAWMKDQIRPTYGTVISGYSFILTGNNKQLFNVRLDYDDLILYTRGASGTSGDYNLIDMDNPSDVGRSGVFSGFTTGEVFVKIDLCTNTYGGIVVTEIGGQKLGGELTSKPVNDSYFKVFAEDELPNGIVGYTYKLPKTHTESYLFGKVNVNIELELDGYSYASQIEDGVFKPSVAGDYILSYFAVDNFGSVCEKTYTFTVVENPKEFIVSDLSKQPVISEYYIFEYELSGGYGEIVSQVIYSQNGRVLPQDELGRVKITNKDDLLISVIATDYNGYEKPFEFIKKVKSEVIEFDIDRGNIPSVLRVGETLIIPEVKAINYLLENEAEVTVSINGQVVLGKEYIVQNNDTKISLVFSAKLDNETVVSEEFNILVESSNSVAADMFVCDRDEYQVVTLSSGIIFYISQSGSDYSLVTAPYVLSARDLEFSFALAKEYLNFDEFIIRLENPNDSTNAIYLTLKLNDENATLKLNGVGGEYPISLSKGVFQSDASDDISAMFNDEQYFMFSFRYNCWDNSLRDISGKKLFVVDKDLIGRNFYGFEGNLVRLSLGYKNVKDDCAFAIMSLGGQKFSQFTNENYEKADNAGPTLWLNSEIKEDMYCIGSEFVIPAAKAYDVLQFESNVNVSVIKNGRIIINKQSADINTAIILDEEGTYTIMYTATDSLNNSVRYSFSIYATDLLAPEILIKGNYNDVKVGDKLTILDYTVNEEYGNILNKLVYVTDPYGKNTIVKVKQNFEIKYSGTYIITYIAVDDAGNQSMVSVQIVAKG